MRNTPTISKFFFLFFFIGSLSSYGQRSLTIIINDLDATTTSATQFFSTVFSESKPKLDQLEVNIFKGSNMKSVNRIDWMNPAADEILMLEAQTIAAVVKRNGTAAAQPVSVDCGNNLCDKLKEITKGSSSILWNDSKSASCTDLFSENRKINNITGNIFTSGNAATLARLINAEFDNKEKFLNVVIYLENKSVLSRFSLSADQTTFNIEPEGIANVNLKVSPDNIGQPDAIIWTPEPTQTGFNSAVLRPLATTTYTAIAKHKSGCDSAPLSIEVQVKSKKKAPQPEPEPEETVEFEDEEPQKAPVQEREEEEATAEEPAKKAPAKAPATAKSAAVEEESEAETEDAEEACNCETGPKMKDVFGKVDWLKYHSINSNEDVVDGFKFYSRQSGGRVFDLITTRVCATKFKLKIYNKDGEEIWQKSYSLADVQSSGILSDSKKFTLDKNFVFKMDLTQLDPEQWRGDNFFQVQIDAMDDDSNRCAPYRSPYLVFTKCPE
jgi:hypothetical protein